MPRTTASNRSLSVAASFLNGAVHPSGDVLGDAAMDSDARASLSAVPTQRTVESGVAVMRDGTTVAPTACSNEGCSFPPGMDASQVRFVVHRHVPSNYPDSRYAGMITRMREMPGPGDHAFPVLAKAPNYFETPSGAFKVLEYSSGAWQVRAIGGTGAPVPWHPRDAVFRRPLR
jgi:hypothetical protein